MSVVLLGSTSGSITLQEPAIAGTTVLDLPNTSGTLVVAGGAQTVQFGAGSASAPSVTFTGDTNTGIFSPGADTIAFSEGGVESMRIDSSGNIGVGVVPSAWSSVGNTLQFGLSGALMGNGNSSASVLMNTYYDGTNYRHINTGAASRLAMTGGLFAFQSASSNTAGGIANLASTVTFTAAGDVGIGTSSPSSKFDVVGGRSTFSANSENFSVYLRYNNSTSGFYIGSPSADAMAFSASSGAERMRITSAGDVGIGTSSPTTVTGGRGFTLYGNGTFATLSVQAFEGANNDRNATLELLSSGNGGSYSQILYGDVDTTPLTPSPLVFAGYHSGTRTERMRIASDGLVGIGTSSPGSKLEVSDNSGNPTIVVRTQNASSFPIEALQTSASYIGPGIRSRVTTKAVGGDYQAFSYYNDNAGAYRFLVTGTGNVQNTNGSYGTISDVKLKENIVDATSKLDKVNQLQVRNYNFIGDELKQIGFVAQEFEQVFPSMVEESADKDVDGNDLGTTTKTIKTTVLIPILVKAIQEQQQIINDLKARIETLENT